MKGVCALCHREMKIVRNGEILRFEVLKDGGRYHESMRADRYGCPDCGHEAFLGFGRSYHDEEETADFVVQI